MSATSVRPLPVCCSVQLSASSPHLARLCGVFRGGRVRSRSLRSLSAQKARRAPAARAATVAALVAAEDSTWLPAALLFDCDGVLVDTERDGHRVSFNLAFQQKGIPVTWSVEEYGELLKIGGGKERMTHYFGYAGWPSSAPSSVEERKAFIADLHKLKTALFMQLVERGELPLRPGVARLIDEAMANGVPVAVCSTSNEKAVSAIVSKMLGRERAQDMQIFAGDVVPRKKPDPAIYTLAAQTLNVQPQRCLVVEDSHIGLTAAKAAGMMCVVTKSGYTAKEDFSAADTVLQYLGDPPQPCFGIHDIVELCNQQFAHLSAR